MRRCQLMSGCDMPTSRESRVDGHRPDLGQEADHAQARLVAERAIEGPETAQVVLDGGLHGWMHHRVLLYQMRIYM